MRISYCGEHVAGKPRETYYFYFTKNPRVNPCVYISNKKHDFHNAAKWLQINPEVKIVCYSIYASRAQIANLRVNVENIRRNGGIWDGSSLGH